MKKQKLMALVLSVLLLMPTVAFAKGNPHNETKEIKDKPKVVTEEKQKQQQTNNEVKKSEKKANEVKQNNEVKKDEKKQQIEAFKTQMKVKHETMKQIRQQTVELKKQIQVNKTELNSIMTDIKAGKKTLSEDMLNSLLLKADALKVDSNEVKATAGINKDAIDAQSKVNKKDFNNALSALDKVIVKLQGRLDALKKLNVDLNDALAIAKLATEPASPTTPIPVDSTTPTLTEGK